MINDMLLYDFYKLIHLKLSTCNNTFNKYKSKILKISLRNINVKSLKYVKRQFFTMEFSWIAFKYIL